MSEAILEKAVCVNCGEDVREGTSFCYNCGKKIAVDPVDTVEASTEPTRAENDIPVGEQLTRAAEQRRKARVGQRKPKEYVWEPNEDSRFVLLSTVVIAILALVVVLLMVFWK